MPRCLEPNQRIRIVLDCDHDKPAATQPAFFVKAFSARAWRTVTAETETPKSNLDHAIEVVQMALVDWVNMVDPDTGQPIPFSADSLDQVCGPGECAELFQKLIEQTMLSAADKKKLESRSASGSENSAPAAAPGNA